MQVEDLIIQKMSEKKVWKIKMLNGLKVRRPEPHAILSEEIYANAKNPFDEKQTITALVKLWTSKRIKTFETKKDGNLITWWALK